MCYEERFFKQWAAKKTPKRDETKPVIERAPPSGQAARPSSEPKKTREVERELETA